MKLAPYAFAAVAIVGATGMAIDLGYGAATDAHTMGMAIGHLIAVILLSLLAGVIAFFIAKRSNRAASLAVAIAAILLLLSSLNTLLTKAPTPRERLERGLISANRTLPVAVDAITKLTKVAIEGDRLVYCYTVEKSAQLPTDEAHKAAFIKTVKQAMDANPSSVKDMALAAGLGFHYRYLQDSAVILEFDL